MKMIIVRFVTLTFLFVKFVHSSESEKSDNNVSNNEKLLSESHVSVPVSIIYEQTNITSDVKNTSDTNKLIDHDILNSDEISTIPSNNSSNTGVNDSESNVMLTNSSKYQSNKIIEHDDSLKLNKSDVELHIPVEIIYDPSPKNHNTSGKNYEYNREVKDKIVELNDKIQLTNNIKQDATNTKEKKNSINQTVINDDDIQIKPNSKEPSTTILNSSMSPDSQDIKSLKDKIKLTDNIKQDATNTKEKNIAINQTVINDDDIQVKPNSKEPSTTILNSSMSPDSQDIKSLKDKIKLTNNIKQDATNTKGKNIAINQTVINDDDIQVKPNLKEPSTTILNSSMSPDSQDIKSLKDKIKLTNNIKQDATNTKEKNIAINQTVINDDDIQVKPNSKEPSTTILNSSMSPDSQDIKSLKDIDSSSQDIAENIAKIKNSTITILTESTPEDSTQILKQHEIKETKYSNPPAKKPEEPITMKNSSSSNRSRQQRRQRINSENKKNKVQDDISVNTTKSNKANSDSNEKPTSHNPRKGIRQRDPVVPIVQSENYVYSHSGDFHYSYESGDGTKAFEEGRLRNIEDSMGEAVVGSFSYIGKDGKDYSISYTADENGYRPVGDHLPTPPPIPPAIARALKYLATKTTPEPVTESI